MIKKNKKRNVKIILTRIATIWFTILWLVLLAVIELGYGNELVVSIHEFLLIAVIASLGLHIFLKSN